MTETFARCGAIVPPSLSGRSQGLPTPRMAFPKWAAAHAAPPFRRAIGAGSVGNDGDAINADPLLGPSLNHFVTRWMAKSSLLS